MVLLLPFEPKVQMRYTYANGPESVVRCYRHRRPFTLSKKYISEVSWSILIEFHITHHQAGEKAAWDAFWLIGVYIW